MQTPHPDQVLNTFAHWPLPVSRAGPHASLATTSTIQLFTFIFAISLPLPCSLSSFPLFLPFLCLQVWWSCLCLTFSSLSSWPTQLLTHFSDLSEMSFPLEAFPDPSELSQPPSSGLAQRPRLPWHHCASCVYPNWPLPRLSCPPDCESQDQLQLACLCITGTSNQARHGAGSQYTFGGWTSDMTGTILKVLCANVWAIFVNAHFTSMPLLKSKPRANRCNLESEMSCVLSD